MSWPTTVGLLTVLALGATLRLWGVGAGAPYRMGADEPIILETTTKMVKTGDFHPHFFDYGGLNFYLHSAVASIAFIQGAAARQWRSLDGVWMGDFLVPTRIATALIGTLTIALVFRVGLRWGERVAFAAALITAVLSPLVREAHFTLTDTPLTCLVAAALWLSIRAAERQTVASAALAGLSVGLATAIKYNGALALVMPLVAALTFPRGRRLSALAATSAASAAAFLVAAPYTLLDLPAFLNGFGLLLQSYNLPRTALDAASIYLGHLRNWFGWPGVLPLGLGYISLVVGLMGFVVLGRRLDPGSHRRSGLIVLSFTLVYFAVVVSQGALIYGRYLLPLSPMLAVALALGTTELSDIVARRAPATRRFAWPVLLALFSLPPASASVAWNMEHARQTTMDQTASWLASQTGPEDVVVMEGAAVQLPPRVKIVRARRLVEKTAEEYRAAGVVYLVATSDISNPYYADRVGRAAEVEAHRTLLAHCEVVQTFAPTTNRPGPVMTILRVPHGSRPN